MNSRRSLRRLRLLFACACLVPLGGAARADVKLPAIFGDHMVLQRDGTVPVWGTAEPGETVTVTAGAATGTATAGADGAWIVKLASLPASSTPIDLVVAGKNTVTFHDVLVGDVWVCSGQSNMEFGIHSFITPDELAAAGDPQIRLFSVPKRVAPDIAKDIAPAPPNFPLLATWQVCTPETLVKTGEWSGFSAVGFYFGRSLREVTHQPVGLIGTYWGGTRIQSWTSLAMLQTLPQKASAAKSAVNLRDNYDQIKQTYEAAAAQWKADNDKWVQENQAAVAAFPEALKQWKEQAKAAAAAGQPAPPRLVEPKFPTKPPRDPINDNSDSTALFNGMVAPLIPYGIKGVIWYQGESNGDEPLTYKAELPAMIRDWRAHWGQGDFPFLIVQLPNYLARKPQPAESNWGFMREIQAKTAEELPNAGYVVTIDLGDAGNIHPGDKVDVGLRAAGVARRIAYGDASAPYPGPMFKSATVEGSTIRVAYDKASLGGGLVLGNAPAKFYEINKQTPPAAPPTTVEGFALAGADGKFVWAQAKIDGDTVVVSSPDVAQPAFVRYAWADNPLVTLYNKEGLPAAPFRTDTTQPLK